MAAKGKGGGSFVAVKKLFAAVQMLSFIVIMIVGLKAQVGLVTIAFRAAVVMFVILLVNRIVVKVLSGYEEINSGKAETNRS